MRKAGLMILPAGELNLTQLNDQVYALLRAQIIQGSITAGQSLSAVALASRLGISPTPVRDALRRLSSDGLVDVMPRRGTFVAGSSRKKIQEIFQIRRIIECVAAESLPEVADAVIEKMAAIVNDINALREGEVFGDYPRYISLDQEFHCCIVSLLDNLLLNEFYKKLRWSEYVARQLSQSDYQRAQVTSAEHEAITHAFRERDVAKAKVDIVNHLSNAESDLLRRIASPK